MTKEQINKLLIDESAYWDAPMNEVKIRQYAEELMGLDERDLRASVQYFRRQAGRRQMPMPADYIAAIPDGHLSTNESWAMIPKNEDDACVWSEEMRLAYGACRSLIREGNITGAFFVYKESYERLVAEAKQKRQRPKWTLTESDSSKSATEAAVIEAVHKGRFTLQQACLHYPQLEYSAAYEPLALTYGDQVKRIANTEGSKTIQAIVNSTVKSIPK